MKAMMRAIILCLMLMLMGASPILSPVSASEPPDGGASITITGEHIWSQDDTLNGTVIVPSGANLTIRSTLMVADGSFIQVEEGGILVLADGGSLISKNDETGYGWMRNNDENDRSRIMPYCPSSTPIPDSNYDVRIFAAEGTVLDGFNAITGDISTPMSGTQHNITGVDTWIHFTGITSLNLVLAPYIEISECGQIEIQDIPHENWMITSDPRFEIDIKGEMRTHQSVIQGAGILVEGKLDLNDSSLFQSSPIVAENSAEVLMHDVELYDSRDDHHVTAGIDTHLDIPYASVQVQGTLVDFWERQLEQQIQFRANEVMASMTDFGHPPETTNPIPVDATGLMTLPKRTVEIGFADGTLWNEQATIVIQSYKTAWNPQLMNDYGSIEPLPIEALTNYTSPNLPMLSIDSITPEETSRSVADRIRMNATITNSGGGDARIALECFLGNGSIADVGGYPILEIPAGETHSVEFNWNMFEPGNTTISCGVIQPSQLVLEGTFGGGVVDSDVVMWTEAIQAESGLGVLPIIIVVFILLIGGGIGALQMLAKEKEREEGKQRSLEPLDED